MNHINRLLLTPSQLSGPNITRERIYKTTTCSNVPFLEAVWAAAKRSSKIIELRRHTGLVDIAADNGLEWIKVSTLTDRRLLSKYLFRQSIRFPATARTRPSANH